MDEIVKAALRKWPNVPHCYGWLALDARGDWYMRDDRIQAAGPFPKVKGSRIEHEKLREFIARNYGHDDAGAWFFQNGPQRVYVELEATPLIWRVNDDLSICDHFGRVAQWRASLLDEQGRLYLQTDTGFGLVHTMDMLRAAGAVEHGQWTLQAVAAAELPARFGYVMSPQARQPK